MDSLASSSPPSKASSPIAIPTTCLSQLSFKISGDGKYKVFSDIFFQLFTVFIFRIFNLIFLSAACHFWTCSVASDRGPDHVSV